MTKSKDDHREQEDKGEKNKGSTTSPVEWGVAGAGLILLSSMLVYMAFLAITQEEGPPLPVITSGEPTVGKAGYTVPYTLANEGQTAASEIIITGQLLRGAEVVEERHGMVDFAAQESEQEGRLIFQQDPRQYRMVVSVSGFTLP